MNDRFKFRVWDNINNRYVNKGILLRCGELAIPSMKNDYDMNPVDGRYLIEQCTGLKDKNGKLIYENDYVKIKDNIYKVFWNKTKISLDNILKKDIIDVDITQNMEVIGNVHETRNFKKV